MAQRKNLKERLGLVQGDPREPDEVAIKVPSNDPGSQLVEEAAAGFAAVQALFIDRNLAREKAQALHRELVYTRNAMQAAQREAAYWREQAMNHVSSNGKLTSLLTQIDSMFQAAAQQVRAVQSTNELMQKPEPMVLKLGEHDLLDPMVQPPGGQSVATHIEPPVHDNGGAPMPTVNELAAALAERFAAEGGNDESR